MKEPRSNGKTMKQLILVRHAKSDWPEETSDFDRPLADSGLQDALKMSKFLKDMDYEQHNYFLLYLKLLY